VVRERRWGYMAENANEWLQFPGKCAATVADCNKAWKVILRTEARKYAALQVERALKSTAWTAEEAYFWIALISAGTAAMGFVAGAIVVFSQ